MNISRKDAKVERKDAGAERKTQRFLFAPFSAPLRLCVKPLLLLLCVSAALAQTNSKPGSHSTRVRPSMSAEAKALLDSAESKAGAVSQRGMIAAAYEAVGAPERAVPILRTAVDGHDLWLAHYFTAAPYDQMRKDPRVADLFKKVSAH